MVIHFPSSTGGAGYQPPKFYDYWYSKGMKWYEGKPEKSQYYILWKKMLELSEGRIIDIGCGPGQVCELAISMRIPYLMGIDFSQVAIDKAIERCDIGPFICGDTMNIFPSIEQKDYDTVFICETLEHMKDDLAFIDLIPRGKIVVASLPTFGSGGHVFYIDHEGDLITRYGSSITLLESGKIAGWIYFKGVKK